MASCGGRLRYSIAAENIPAAPFALSDRYTSSVALLDLNQRREGARRIVMRPRVLVKEAVAGSWIGDDVEDVLKKGRRRRVIKCVPFEREAATVCNDGGVDRRAEVMVAAAITVVLGVGNRVLYKLALVPLKHYPFFLAQLATFGYVIVYFSILFMRCRVGKVTSAMLSLPKMPLVFVGLLEALAAAAGMSAAAILSGAAIPILSQSFLVWQLALSYIFLGRRYRLNQLFGCFLVAAGVIITVASGSGTGSLVKSELFWSILMIISFLFQAGDTVLKEMIFLNAAKILKGTTCDIFIVNSFGSAFQAAFIWFLLPFLSNLWGIPFSQLPSYIKDGAACFLNAGTMATKCDGAPLLPLLFVTVNMAYNISLLHLIKISSAVVSSLASTISVPVSVYLFTLPLPYHPVVSTLPSGFVAGAFILTVGVFIYTWTPTPDLSSSVVG